ncbi:Uu.00g146240.m01.CDS01 [Anthostomella pinea]|uniref:Polynucleotide 5'-hydroxyl-kinase GRC3 n=1 Tax=Anthostomella pinea TaxID=933095 RepID=A0AAI8VS33_9PEZI|nr:Uu.00g146240.m01.CDS01 [Anthostomella pinea]
MATNKRRRLDITDSTQPMSAFALRKKLLAQKSPVVTSTVDHPEEAASVEASNEGPTEVATSKKSKRTHTTRQTSLADRTAEEGSNLDSNRAHSSDGNLTSNPDIFPNPSVVLPRSPSPALTDEQEIPIAPQAVHFSSYRPSKSSYHRKKGGNLQLKLVEVERLVILGSYGVCVDSGEVTINGAALRPSKKAYWVDAPHCHALPVIRCAKNATVEFQSRPGAEGLRKLGRLSPHFRRLWNEASYSPSYETPTGPESTFQILYTSRDGPKRTLLQDLVSPAEWNREVAKLLTGFNSKPASIMVTGPKSSGKSTFGKILTNRFLSNTPTTSKQRVPSGVAVLDLDPGQPEYCIAGQIALVLITEPVLGPSFCHPLPSSGIRLVRSHALASISPASDPELFLEAAMDLMTHYRNVLGSCPLVINTPGWIQGTGLDLLVSLIGGLRPSEVIYMSQTGPAEAVESLQEACKTSGFSTLPSQTTQYTLRTAAHLRSMQTMAYFHSQPQSTDVEGHHIQWSTKPLSHIPPWQVSYRRGPNRGIFGVMCYDYQASPDLLADAINGTILAVVEVESAKAFKDLASRDKDIADHSVGSAMELDDDQSNAPKPPSWSDLQDDITAVTPEGIPFIETSRGTTLDPRYSRSLGLALVRGIDVENEHLQLLTPIASTVIEEVTAKGGEIVLVSGKFDSPSWAYTEDLYYRLQDEDDDAVDADTMEVDEDGTPNTASEDGNVANDRGDAASGPTPWIEVLRGNQKRGAGSKVWRVRRDLGRHGNTAD